MKLVTYTDNVHQHLGIYIEDKIYNLPKAASLKDYKDFPDTMKDFLEEGESVMAFAKELDHQLKNGKLRADGIHVNDVTLLAPVPHPTSCRDGYAFRQHVAAARRNRKVEMIPEFDEYPVFYFTNHHSVRGPGLVPCMPDH